MTKHAKQLNKKKKVLIFGCNSMVNEVARQLLNKQLDITVISRDNECIKRLAHKHIRIKDIDYTDDEQLKSLGIGNNVSIIFSFFKEDAKNVYLIISAKDIAPEVLIITQSQEIDSSEKLRAAGADKVIDPYKISGRKIFNLIKNPLLSETIEHVVFGETAINLAEIEISDKSPLLGKTLGDIHFSGNNNLIFLGVVNRKSGDEFIFRLSATEHQLVASDLLVVIGTSADIEQLKKTY